MFVRVSKNRAVNSQHIVEIFEVEPVERNIVYEDVEGTFNKFQLTYKGINHIFTSKEEELVLISLTNNQVIKVENVETLYNLFY